MRSVSSNPYDTDLERNPANFQPLTPLSFLQRTAEAHPDLTAIIHGARRYSYAEFYARSRRLASALAREGIRRGDTVSVLLANTPAMLEAHHGVPMTGAVLNALNTRLDPASIAFMLDHSGAKVLIADLEFAECANAALAAAKVKPLVILYDDPEFPQVGKLPGAIDYEAFLSNGDPDFAWTMPQDEWDAISLNYTSGTTGNPKGVVCHHRGAALMGYANILACRMAERPVYLWTLPMFHCNGWCFPWTLALVRGIHVCLRWVRAKEIYAAIAEHGVTHLCGAPTVMAALLNAAPEEKRAFTHRVNFVHAAAPPPEAMLLAMLASGFDLTHVYGLTETYGPATVNEWHMDWDQLPLKDQGAKRIRQGVAYPALEQLKVLDPDTLEPVPPGRTDARRSHVPGQYRDEGLSQEPESHTRGDGRRLVSLGRPWGDASRWLYPAQRTARRTSSSPAGRTSPLSRWKMRSTNIPPCYLRRWWPSRTRNGARRPAPSWRKRPEHESVTEADLIAFCRENLARFKCPKTIVFCELPKTSTGKIQKFRLREQAKTLS